MIPSPSPWVKIQIMGGKVCLRLKGKTLLGVVTKLLKTITQQCFALLPQVNFPANNLNFPLKVKVMGSNPGYLLKSFLLYCLIYIKSVYKRMSLYKCPLYDHSWPFSCHMCEHLSQNWGSDGHFEVLNMSYLWLVEKLWRKTQIFPFLFFVILYKNRDFHPLCFLRFCVFYHNFCTS